MLRSFWPERRRRVGHNDSDIRLGHDSGEFARYPSEMGVIDNTILPTAADIQVAAKRLAGIAVRTPLVSSPVLDDVIGARVFLKAETLQRTGSFKFRGAYNKISSIYTESRAA